MLRVCYIQHIIYRWELIEYVSTIKHTYELSCTVTHIIIYNLSNIIRNLYTIFFLLGKKDYNIIPRLNLKFKFKAYHLEFPFEKYLYDFRILYNNTEIQTMLS